MSLTAEVKRGVVEQYRRNETDTGSPEVQVAMLTTRIKGLTDHFANNKQDKHSRYGLVQMVNKRRKLLDYLKGKDTERYSTLISSLGLRR